MTEQLIDASKTVATVKRRAVMTSKSSGRIIVGTNGENPTLCFSVEPGTGSSGINKEFIDIEVTNTELEQLGKDIEGYLERTQKD